MFNMFKKKEPVWSKVQSQLLYANYVVEDVYAACTSCYDNAKPDIDFFKKIEYITKRIKVGHDSVTEHGFVAMIISGLKADDFWTLYSIQNIQNAAQYLRVYTSFMEDNTVNILIGGSIRGYRYLIRNIEERRDPLYYEVISVLQRSVVREFFIDLEEQGYLGEEVYHNFLSVPDIKIVPDGTEYNDTVLFHEYICTEDRVDTRGIPEYCDKSRNRLSIIDHPMSCEMDAIMNKAHEYGFLGHEVANMIPVNVLFENMSRTATHQLVRHRNAITQESQRYVDYTQAPFTVPVNTDKKFKISIFGTNKTMTLTELGEELCKIYGQLTNQGLKKEEARAFLPSNVQCKRLYMTFTIHSLIKFLQLRTDPHAQLEIREYATSLKNLIFDPATQEMNNYFKYIIEMDDDKRLELTKLLMELNPNLLEETE